MNEILKETLIREYGEASAAHYAHAAKPVPMDPLERGLHVLEQDRLCAVAVEAKLRMNALLEPQRAEAELETWYVVYLPYHARGHIPDGHVHRTKDALLLALADPGYIGQDLDAATVYEDRPNSWRKDITRGVAAELFCQYLASGKTIDDDEYPLFCRQHLTRDEMQKLVKP